MLLSHDPQHNVAYLKFQDKRGDVETIKLSDDLLVDVAPDGSLYGIELLNANVQLKVDGLGKFVVVDETTGDKQEIRLAV